MVRLVSGVILAAAALAAILFLPIVALRVLAVAVAALAAHEFMRIAARAEHSHDARLAMTSSSPGFSALRESIGVLLTLALGAVIAWQLAVEIEILLLVALGWLALDVLLLGTSIRDAGAAIIAPIYTGAPLGMLAVVHATHGWRATLMLIATVIVSDSSQYYSGRSFGRHPLAPSISPKKTVEGAVGGLLCGTAFATLVGMRLFPEAPVSGLVLLGAAIVVLGICGDLFESRLKRAAGMKDSSSLIPGHGGILDRIDALLFAAPAFYVYLRVTS
jgi:phosphatidate cytidylyltransferase